MPIQARGSYAQQIVATAWQIDALVYELYKPIKEEIGMVVERNH
jgi:hypothetical protein